jgi:hypothetical protein
VLRLSWEAVARQAGHEKFLMEAEGELVMACRVNSIVSDPIDSSSLLIPLPPLAFSPRRAGI